MCTIVGAAAAGAAAKGGRSRVGDCESEGISDSRSKGGSGVYRRWRRVLTEVAVVVRIFLKLVARLGLVGSSEKDGVVAVESKGGGRGATNVEY